MAPEQAAGRKDITTSVDVYSLGAILYELLTGQPPFQGASTVETLVQIRSQEPVPLQRLRAKLPRDLATICLKCLEKSPDRRYASAAALAQDLRAFLQGTPIQARQVGVVERAVKWARRRPTIAGLVSAVVMLTILGVAGIAWQWRRAEHQAIVARQQRNDADKERAESNRQSKLAQANLNEARQVLDRLIGVGQQLYYQRGTELKGAAALEQALKFYERFLDQDPRDPAARFEAARAHVQVGWIQTQLGRWTQAEHRLHTAIAILQPLLIESPDDDVLRQQAAIAHLAWGHVLKFLRRKTRSSESYAEAIKIWEELLDGDSSNHSMTWNLANAYGNQASVSLADPDRARQSYQRAYELLCSIPEDSTFHANTLSERSQSLAGLALLSTDERGLEESVSLARKALELSQQARAVDPESPGQAFNVARCYGFLARVLQRHKQYEEEERCRRSSTLLLKQVVKDAPHFVLHWTEFSGAQNGLALCLARRDRFEESCEYSKAAIVAQKKVVELVPKQLEHFKFLTDLYLRLAYHYERADRFVQAKDTYLECRELHQRVLSKSPDDTYSRWKLGALRRLIGAIQTKLGEYPEAEPSCRQAIADFESLIRLDPDSPFYPRELAVANDALATVLDELDRFDEASEYACASVAAQQELVTRFPQTGRYLKQLDTLYRALGHRFRDAGRWSRAIEIYTQGRTVHQRILDKTPDNSYSRWQLGKLNRWIASVQMKRGQYVQAAQQCRLVIADLTHLVAQNLESHHYRTELANAHLVLAQTIFSRGERTPELLEQYRRILELDPARAIAHNDLAWFLSTWPGPELRNLSEARQLAEHAVALKPKQGYYWNTLGIVLYRSGDWSASIEALEKSIELGGNDVMDWLPMGINHWQLGDHEAAAKWYDKAVRWMQENESDDPDLERLRAEADALLKDAFQTESAASPALK